MSASTEGPPAGNTGPHQGTNASEWLITFCAFIFIYILSIGPAAKLYRHRMVPHIIMAIYAPLDLLYQRSLSVRRSIDWYVDDVWHAK